MFSKADKNLVIKVNGEEIPLSVVDDTSFNYLTPIYKDKTDVTKGITGWTTGTVDNPIIVNDSSTSVNWGTEGNVSWYVVTKNVELSKGVICIGTVNLILCDDITLTVKADAFNSSVTGSSAGILVSGVNNSLTIFAQSTGDKVGKLNVTGGDYGAAIGGGFKSDGNNITINGGNITAISTYSAAAIGGGGSYGGDTNAYGNNITINGGTVVAENATLASSSSYSGAAIGGGFGGEGRNITINGGDVTATGSRLGAAIGGGQGAKGIGITINDGNIIATCNDNAAGIGGGSYADGQDITITGGTVTAKCLSKNSTYSGAGIGGGYAGDGINITITGGNVTAYSQSGGAGIGGGATYMIDKKGNGTNIKITGGTVDATGNFGASGIGGGYALCSIGTWSTTNSGNGSNITITGGTVTAKGTYNSNYEAAGAGIGGGGNYLGIGGIGSNITITGGIVNATGGTGAAGIGGGSSYSNKTITNATNIKISGGSVTAIGGTGAVGVGNGKKLGSSGGTKASNISVDSALTLKAGTNNATAVEICTDRDSTTDLSTVSAFKKIYVSADHTHSWTFEVSASNDTITADCGNKPCPSTDTVLTITASNTVYDGTSHSAVYKNATGETATSFIGDILPTIVYYKLNGANWDALQSAPTDAGSYKASFSVGPVGATKTAYVCYSISKADNSWTTQPNITDVIYGTEITLEGTAKFGTYSITYTGTGETSYSGSVKPTKVGTYKATLSVAGTDNYKSLSKDVSFKISKKQLDVTGSTASGKEYDGTTSANVTVGTVSGKAYNSDIVNVIVSKAEFNDKNAGTNKQVSVIYGLTGSDADNYSAPATESLTATISVKDGSANTITAILDQYYTGQPITPNVVVNDDSISAIVGSDNYTLTYEDNTEIGIAKVTVTFQNNYSGTITKDFKIVQKSSRGGGGSFANYLMNTTGSDSVTSIEISGTVAKITVKDRNGQFTDPTTVTISKPSELLNAGAKTAEVRMTRYLMLVIDIEEAMCGKSECVITINNLNRIIEVACDNFRTFAADIKDIYDVAAKVVYDGETVKVYDAQGIVIKEFNV